MLLLGDVRAQLLREPLQHPEALQQAAAGIAQQDAATETGAAPLDAAVAPVPAHGAAGTDEDAATASKSPLVRVRADQRAIAEGRLEAFQASRHFQAEGSETEQIG